MIHQSSHISDNCAIGAFLSFIGLPNCGWETRRPMRTLGSQVN